MNKWDKYADQSQKWDKYADQSKKWDKYADQPKEQSKNPIMQALDWYGKQSIETPLGFVEGATAGIPRTIIEKISGKDLPRGNVLGQMAGTVMGPGKVAKMATGGVKALQGAGLAQKLGRLALEGGILGGLSPREDALDLGRKAKDIATGAVLNPALSGIGTWAGKAIPQKLKDKAVKMMSNYLRPSKKLTESAADVHNMAENALEYGIKGDYDSATMKAVGLTKKTTGDVDKIIDQYTDLPGDIKNPLSYINKASEDARKGLAYSRADDLLENRALIESREGFAKKVPIFADIPTSVGQQNQFVIPSGSVSTSVKPTLQNVPLAGKKNKAILEALKEQLGNISKQSLEKADDVLLIPKSGKQIQMVAPQRTVSTRSNAIQGPSQQTKLVKTQIGTKKEYAPINVGRMQQLKRDIYNDLGAQPFSTEAKIATEKEARKAFASGLRQEIEDVVPDKNVKGLNKRISSLLDIIKTLEDRGVVDARSNPISLTDSVLSSAAFSGKSPELGLLASLRKIISSPSLYSRSAHMLNTLAKGAYELSKKNLAPKLTQASLFNE